MADDWSACRFLSELGPVQDPVVFLRRGAAGGRDDDRRSSARPWSRSRTWSAGPWSTGALASCLRRRSTCAVLALLYPALGDSLDQRQVVTVVLLLTAALYGPLRQRLSPRRAPADAGQPRQPVRRRGRARLDAWSPPTRGPRSSPRSPARWRRRSASGSSRSRSTAPAASASSRRTATARTETRTLPITYRGPDVGRLVLPARGLRSRLSRRDEQLLGDLVRQAATAARTSRLADELQDSRERLVVAREEERRRIRRDLHDGLGPALSGVVFRLESARLLVDRDPETAEGLTSRRPADTCRRSSPTYADSCTTCARRRSTTAGSSARCASRPRRRPLPVEVDADDLGALPAAVEVAAYRIVAEALTNVVRHAAADRCRVRLAARRRSCVVEVADDGVGHRRGRPGRGRAAVAARAGRRARRPQRGHLPGRRRHRGPGGAAAGHDRRHGAGEETHDRTHASASSSSTTTRSSATGWSRCSRRVDGIEVVGTAADGPRRCTWSTPSGPTSW